MTRTSAQGELMELWSQAESNRHLNLAKVAFSH
jgi:hypothetical protein